MQELIYARINLCTPPVQHVTMAYFINLKKLCCSNTFFFIQLPLKQSEEGITSNHKFVHELSE